MLTNPWKDYYPEVENLDVPGQDHFTEFRGVYFTFQHNLRSLIPGAGRWVLSNNITNPKAAFIAYYDDAYWRIDQALEDFKTKLPNANK